MCVDWCGRDAGGIEGVHMSVKEFFKSVGLSIGALIFTATIIFFWAKGVLDFKPEDARSLALVVGSCQACVGAIRLINKVTGIY